MKNKMLNKSLILFIEAVIMIIIRVVQVLSINSVGVVKETWTTAALWGIVIVTVLTALVLKDKKRFSQPNVQLSLGGGISAFFLGGAIIASSAYQYAHSVGMKFTLPTLILGGCASLTLLFVVAPVNTFAKKDIYTSAVKGLPVFMAIWLGFVLIGVFFLNKTSSLITLNSFSILAYSAYIFFFLAYMKLFCGFGDKKTQKQLYRWSLLSVVFLICNIATKIAYYYIMHEKAVAMPYGFGVFGIVLDFALLSFALCNIIRIED